MAVMVCADVLQDWCHMESKMTEYSASEWQRECCVCYTREQEKHFITCEGCGAMIYCSKNCQLDDWGSGDTGDLVNSHQNWCHRMKGYVAREEELSYLPFTFAKETTDRLFHEQLAAEFFKQKGVYGQGLWRRESPLLHKTQPVQKCGYYTHTTEDKWVLPLERSILESPPSSPPPPPTQPLLDWQQYYVFRGLPLHSPIAAVLTYAMTLYYVLTSCLKENEPELLKKLAGGQDFVIHALGVEKEVEMKEAFLECARLLPKSKLHIIMIGKQVAKSVDKYSWGKENLNLSVCRSLYHKAELPPPDLAVGFNAGLPAYPTWPATLSKLKSQGTPAYFTDQSQYSCDCAASAVSSIGITGISSPLVNPFRSPLRIVTREQNMPWFPNAFLFCLVYKDR